MAVRRPRRAIGLRQQQERSQRKAGGNHSVNKVPHSPVSMLFEQKHRSQVRRRGRLFYVSKFAQTLEEDFFILWSKRRSLRFAPGGARLRVFLRFVSIFVVHSLSYRRAPRLPRKLIQSGHISYGTSDGGPFAACPTACQPA